MRRLLVLLALFTLLLPACAAAQPAAPRSPGVGQDNAEITIRIAVLPVLETLPLYVADREGYFAARNVKVEIVPFRAPLERDTALITGQVEAQYTDLMSAMLLNRDEPRTQVINAVIRSTPEQPRFFLLVSPQSNITAASQLRNTDIAISRNTVIEYVADMLTQREGLRESEIRKIDVQAIPARLELLARNQVQAAVLPEPFRTQAVADGARVLLDDGRASLFVGVLNFNRSILTARPDGVRRFLQAYNEAVTAINAEPAKYLTLMNETANVPPPIRDRMSVPRFPLASVPTLQDMEPVQRWLIDKGALTRPIDLNAFVSADYLPR